MTEEKDLQQVFEDAAGAFVRAHLTTFAEQPSDGHITAIGNLVREAMYGMRGGLEAYLDKHAEHLAEQLQEQTRDVIRRLLEANRLQQNDEGEWDLSGVPDQELFAEVLRRAAEDYMWPVMLTSVVKAYGSEMEEDPA